MERLLLSLQPTKQEEGSEMTFQLRGSVHMRRKPEQKCRKRGGRNPVFQPLCCIKIKTPRAKLRYYAVGLRVFKKKLVRANQTFKIHVNTLVVLLRTWLKHPDNPVRYRITGTRYSAAKVHPFASFLFIDRDNFPKSCSHSHVFHNSFVRHKCVRNWKSTHWDCANLWLLSSAVLTCTMMPRRRRLTPQNLFSVYSYSP